jgi:hypothetical protein
MKKVFALLSAAFLLTACGGGPQTVQYGNATLTYDSGTWEAFSNELATGLGVKGDESCWIDLSGDLTTPLEGEGLEEVSDGVFTLYSDGTPQYLSFAVGSETVYGRVSVEDPGNCVAKLMDLASDTLGE